MEGDHVPDAVDRARCDHLLRAHRGFFSGLEDDPQIRSRIRFLQNPSLAHQRLAGEQRHGRMGIMTTCMTAAGILRSPGHGLLVIDRDTVYVCAYRHPAVIRSTDIEIGDHSRARQLMQFIAKRIHAIRKTISRAEFLSGEFRMSVQIPSKPDHPFIALLELLTDEFKQLILEMWIVREGF